MVNMARKYQRQYHLVVLMLVMLCVAVLCGYIQSVLRENSIREFIINQGGYVAFRKRNASVVERLILECFSKRPIAIYGIRIDKETENIAEVLKLAQKIEHLTRIDFADSHVSDEDLSALPFLSTVNYVSLQNCKVSSVGASHLVRTPKLAVLSLQNTDVREVHFLEGIKSLAH